MRIADLLKSYLDQLGAVARIGDAREESFYPALRDLLDRLGQAVNHPEVMVTVQPRPTEAGNPDFRIWDGQSKIIGYIEAKAPSADLAHIENTEQVRRYRDTFPNFILTNFVEFYLYRNGHRVASVAIGRPFLLTEMRTAPPPENAEEFLKLFDTFYSFAQPPAATPEALATELAKRARLLRDVVERELLRQRQAGRGDLLGFHEAFEKYLIHDLSIDEFADLYAQTVTYGLFAARTRAKNGFTRRGAVDHIPRTVGVLRDMFRFISSVDLPTDMQWSVEDIMAVLASADVAEMLDQFYRRGKGADPIVHFYETFLAAYDPEERERRGVYYTPDPVVSYIVRSLQQLLQQRFGRTDGLADSDVTLLDPAAGTMTFVARAAEVATNTFATKYGDGARATFIKERILPNYCAFELMVAPYAVGHLKMSFFLEELGYRPEEGDRVRFYLTNTLDMAEPGTTTIPGVASLSEESRLASRVKQEERILVILGNPPYSGHSANKGEWILKQLEAYKRVDGQPLGEKNPKWLQDDYVKFIRFAQWKIEQAGRGVVGMITNHSYLDNPTFRGMRRSLMETFDEIYVLDLHGNALKREVCPDGSPDENVFDIRQGVAIAFFVKTGEPLTRAAATIHHADLWGSREHKYEWLSSHDWSSTDWQPLEPRRSMYFLVPRDGILAQRYERYPRINDLFRVSSVGIVTARDKLTIHWTPDEVWNTVRVFASMDPEEARRAYRLGQDVRDWKVKDAQDDLKGSGLDRSRIIPILYRPFDIRYTYYTGRSRGFHCMPRFDVMRHMLAGPNVALITPKRVEHVGGWSHVLATTRLSEHVAVSLKTIDYHFPLYLFEGAILRSNSEGDPPTRVHNLSQRIMRPISETFGVVPRLARVPSYLWEAMRAVSHQRLPHSSLGRKRLEDILSMPPFANFTWHRDYQIERLVVDFYCPEMKIVVDVISHDQEASAETHAVRAAFLQSQGFEVLRVKERSLLSEPDGVRAALEEACKHGSDRGPDQVLPEDIFNYIYGVLHAPSYRERYAEFLRTDFPRVPFPTDPTVFEAIAQLGDSLIGLHLLSSPDLDPPLARFEGYGDRRIAAGGRTGVRYDAENQRVYINPTQYFGPVTPAVWSFTIGGYTVCEKWLSDRKGRTLSLEEIQTYCRVVTALARTLEVQAEIDEWYALVEEEPLLGLGE